MRDLMNSYFVLKTCSFGFCIDHIDSLTSYSKSLLGEKLFYAILKNTMGRHFTAGETQQEVLQTIEKLQKIGFKIAVNYMAEFVDSEEAEKLYDSVAKANMDVIDFNKINQSSDYFFAIKFSGLVKEQILRKMNQNQTKLESIFMDGISYVSDKIYFKIQKRSVIKIRICRLFPQINVVEIDDFIKLIPNLSSKSNPDEINLIEWRLCVSSFNLVNPKMNDHPVWKALTNYSDFEMDQIHKFTDRLFKTVDHMKNIKSYMLIDAEQSFVQMVIDNFTEQLMYLENFIHKRPTIFNTIQNYLIKCRFSVNHEISKKEFFGEEYPILIKFVKGAYHKEEQRIELSEKKEIVYKVQSETDQAYIDNSFMILENFTQNCRFVVASHSDETVRLIDEKINKMSNNEEVLKQTYFATLIGLNDRLAYKCLLSGKKTIKYMPFGERHLTLPYMIRRAHESRDLILKHSDELEMYRDEIIARLLRDK